MQVLGLARALRSRGLEARVLGPCDGPPPESFVTPLGNSLPTSANGSIAPLAPDPPAMFRTLQALSAERFDVVHLHEPLAPGPTLTAAVTHRYPTVGTFHAAGTSASYQLIKPWLLSWIKRIDHKVVVSKDALELVSRILGVTTRCCSMASRWNRSGGRRQSCSVRVSRRRSSSAGAMRNARV